MPIAKPAYFLLDAIYQQLRHGRDQTLGYLVDGSRQDDVSHCRKTDVEGLCDGLDTHERFTMIDGLAVAKSHSQDEVMEYPL